MPEKNKDAGNILAVVVLYKVQPNNSAAFRTLQAAIEQLGEERNTVHALLYDNTKDAMAPEELPSNVLYVVAPRNDGIAGAYNYALHLAMREGFQWMLVLDQDTNLPPDFLERLHSIALRLQDVEEVGAIVPHLLHVRKVLSPVRIRPWGVEYLSCQSAGFLDGEIHGFNSGSLFRVKALRQMGGFDPRFWLDYQDAYVYRQLHLCGRRVYIGENLVAQHDLSLLSEKQNMSADRYWNFLLAESAYCDLYRGLLARLTLTARVLGRLWRQRHGANPAIRRLTQKAFRRRITESRAMRIDEWNREMRQRTLDSAQETDSKTPDARPAISVCMAAYNGERYITAQTESILSQLAPDDELIVVDDASRDATREKVLALQDSRIRLIEHKSNKGVSRTFEDAIRAASGSILFLSDQDDLWRPDKVKVMLETFHSHPHVTLISTDVALIDSEGRLISESYFQPRGEFRPGLWANLLRNRFGGCTMAFRAELIGEILPLPHRYDVLHDIWIGVRNSLSGHKALYIPQALVLNRRHMDTATGKAELSISRKIRIRAHLLLSLANFRLQRIM